MERDGESQTGNGGLDPPLLYTACPLFGFRSCSKGFNELNHEHVKRTVLLHIYYDAMHRKGMHPPRYSNPFDSAQNAHQDKPLQTSCRIVKSLKPTKQANTSS